MKPETKSAIIIVLSFIAAYLSLNLISTLPFHILGIALIIFGLFGIISIHKTGKFIFN